MTDIHRVRTTWVGMPGAPGVSTMYLGSAPAAADLTAIKNFFNTFGSWLPSTATLQVEGSGDKVDDATGELTGSWISTAPAPILGASGAVYAAPAGMCIHWLTNSVVNGRRVKGTTYIVPLVNKFQSNGTVEDAFVATVAAAATALITALGANFIVWHRPKFGPKPGPGIPRPRLSDGSSEGIIGARVPDKAVVLRSRRD